MDSVPRRARGELFRQAFVAGLALHQLDERLPALIATMLTKELTADQVVELIAQTTGWKPSHASIKDVISLTLGERMVVPVGEVLKSDSKQATKEALKVVRKKMSGFV
nr:plasmid partitioning/stability family protein [Yersinia kristensenii]